MAFKITIFWVFICTVLAVAFIFAGIAGKAVPSEWWWYEIEAVTGFLGFTTFFLGSTVLVCARPGRSLIVKIEN